MPGVRDAAVSSGIPFGAGNYTTHPMLAGGQSVLPAGTAVPIDWRIVSPGYFRTLRIPLLRGRDFTDAGISLEIRRKADCLAAAREENPKPLATASAPAAWGARRCHHARGGASGSGGG